jgi:hypothetical protein
MVNNILEKLPPGVCTIELLGCKDTKSFGQKSIGGMSFSQDVMVMSDGQNV